MALYQDDFVTIHHGDCLDVMRGMDADCIDAIVTDPPYGLSFMGREWDHGVPGEPFWAEALRVAKPGAHLVAFGGTRTYHRLTCAIEDAGWEIRDCLGWLYGSGFPKSLDVSKAIDKAAGAIRDREPCGGLGTANSFADDKWTQENMGRRVVDAPITEAAAKWQGYGTALKPAWEPIILARKPLSGTVAANVQHHGTGALNVDGCRVEGAWTGSPSRQAEDITGGSFAGGNGKGRTELIREQSPLGRWPANIVHDGSDEVLAVLGEQSRFFYTAKASKAERDEGLCDVPEQRCSDRERDDGVGGDNPRSRTNNARRNFHPTVKPLDLMRWLVRLVTPPDGVVLDPFMGSGTTLKAARAEGHLSIGVDLELEHCDIAWGRMSQGVMF